MRTGAATVIHHDDLREWMRAQEAADQQWRERQASQAASQARWNLAIGFAIGVLIWFATIFLSTHLRTAV